MALATGGDSPSVRTPAGSIWGDGEQGDAVGDASQPLTDVLTSNKVLFFSSVDDVAAAHPSLFLPDDEGDLDGFLAAAIPMSANVGEPPLAALGFVTGTDCGLSPTQQAIADRTRSRCRPGRDAVVAGRVVGVAAFGVVRARSCVEDLIPCRQNVAFHTT